MKRALFAFVAGAGLVAASLAPIALSGEAHTAPLAPPATWSAPASLSPLVEAVQPAVLAIEVEGSAQAPVDIPPMFREFFGEAPEQRQVHGEGSGFIISREGLVLTNHHVIDRADRVRARLSDGTLVEAKVLGSDPRIDVALLQLVGDSAWPHLTLGSSEAAKVGDYVLAAGNPLGLGHTVTSGIISGKGRALGHDGFDDFIQTDAAINQGNSGGPLFNMRGEVIGINTAIIQGANTVGFAVPIDLVQRSLEDLRTLGRVSRGFLGVVQQPVDGPLAEHCGIQQIERGSLVEGVMQDTPAATAGLAPCDVIVSVNGREIADPSALIKAVGMLHPGDEVDLSVVRKGRKMPIHLALGEAPSRPGEAIRARTDAPPAQVFGLTVQALTREEQTHLGVSNGVRVQSIAPGSPARRVLAPGDILLEIDGHPVGSPEEVEKQLERGEGDAILASVLRERTVRLIAIPRIQ